MQQPEQELFDEMGPTMRRPPVNTTQPTLNLYRSRGYIVDVAEHYNAFSGRRHDLFQFADVVAVNESEVLFIQTTTRQHISARRNKMSGIPAVEHLSKLPGVRVIILGWYKDGARWAYKEEVYNGEKSSKKG